mgnify:CR=1 FL=1
MNDDNKTPLAYQFRMRMRDLLLKGITEGTTDGDADHLDFDVLGYTVYGGDQLLQQNPSLVADLIGYELGGLGVTEDDLVTIVQAMMSRRYNDEFNRD